MKKAKKVLLALTLCLVLVVSCFASAFAVESRAIVMQCPRCGEGEVVLHRTINVVGSEEVPCTHHAHGYDYCDVLEDAYTGSCSSCSYSAYEVIGSRYPGPCRTCEGYD